MPVRYAFQAAMRAAAVTLLRDYAADAELKLQVYPGRPRSLHPPTAFVDGLRESVLFTGPRMRQRTVTAEVVVLHGTFDSADTADQRDEFVDGFTEWVTENVHAAGANTTIGGVAIEDEPNYVPVWLPPAEQRDYYATRISLEGFATD